MPSKSKRTTETLPTNDFRSSRTGSGVRGVRTSLYGFEEHDGGVTKPRLNDLSRHLCAGVTRPEAGDSRVSSRSSKVPARAAGGAQGLFLGVWPEGVSASECKSSGRLLFLGELLVSSSLHSSRDAKNTGLLVGVRGFSAGLGSGFNAGLGRPLLSLRSTG